MRELALFAGGGGGIWGSLLLGHTPVCAVEIVEANRRILLQRQLDGIFPRFPIWDDVRSFNGHEWRGKVDIVSGGFPCQDISCAGKGAGIDGERSGLWSEMARIIGEVRPKFAFVENSPMLVTRGLDRVLCDLAAMGSMRNGELFLRPTWAPLTCANASGFLPTPMAADAERGGRGDLIRKLKGWSQRGKRIPTPSATDWKGEYTLETVSKRMYESRRGVRLPEHLARENLETKTHGKPNPEFWEFVMGWPIGSTAFSPLGTAKFHEWRQQHGGF